MDLIQTPAQRALRAEVREALSAISVPEEITFQTRYEVDVALGGAGLLGVTWPTEFGGRGLGQLDVLAIEQELVNQGFPATLQPSRFSVNLLGPGLYRHGSTEQRRKWLPRILRADDVWCQGFSEPDAGSDLAAVRTTLLDTPDGLRLNGRKIWTTQAQFAGWCFVLAASEQDAQRHHNLSMVIVDMESPGVQVSPIVQLNGDSEFNEVLFEDVVIDSENVIGGRGKGWQVAITTLSAERTYGQLSRFTQFGRELQQLVADLRPDDVVGRREAGRLAARIAGIRALALRTASLEDSGRAAEAAALAPILKLWWSETHRDLTAAGWLVEAQKASDESYWWDRSLESRWETIAAGTSQIQRNIIAERGLDLPRYR